MPSSRVVFVQYTEPGRYPPLVHAARILSRQGFALRFIGLGLHDGQPTPMPADLAKHARYIGRQCPGWCNYWYYLIFAVYVVFSLRRRDIIYGSDPIVTPILIILVTIGFKVIYHEHDSPSPSPSASVGLGKQLVLKCRRWILDHVPSVFPNAERQKIADPKAASFLVWNCPSLEEVLKGDKQQHPALRIYFHGSLSHQLLPSSVLDAMAICGESVTLRIVGYETPGNEGFVDRFLAHADRLGLSGRVEFLGAMSRERAVAFAADCDVGLCVMDTIHTNNVNLRHLFGASNKVFDYFSQALPVIVDPSPQWDPIVQLHKFGWSCDVGSVGHLGALLGVLARNVDEVRDRGNRSRVHIIAYWNYERQFGPVAKLIDDMR